MIENLLILIVALGSVFVGYWLSDLIAERNALRAENEQLRADTWSAISSKRIADLADVLTEMGLYPADEGVAHPDAVSTALDEIKRLRARVAELSAPPDYLGENE